MSAVELERSILDARDRGDTATLQRLQARYRSEALTTRVAGPGSIALIEERTSPVATSATSVVTEERGAVPTAVVFREEAKTAVLNMPFESSMETGCLLIGYQDDDANVIVVERIAGLKGSNHIGERDTVGFDGDWCSIVDRKAAFSGRRIVGDLHSHRHESTEPSPTDVDGWRGLARGLKRNHVGVLITPDPYAGETTRWQRPEWQAYVATEDGELREIDLRFEWSEH